MPNATISRRAFTEYGINKIELSFGRRHVIIEAHDGFRANGLLGIPGSDAPLAPGFHGRRFKTLAGAERAGSKWLIDSAAVR